MARPRWGRCQSPREAGVHETSFTHLGESQVNSVLFRLRSHSHNCWRRYIKHSASSVHLKNVRLEQINLPIRLTQSERVTVRRCNILYNMNSSSEIKAFFSCGFCTVTDALSYTNNRTEHKTEAPGRFACKTPWLTLCGLGGCVSASVWSVAWARERAKGEKGDGWVPQQTSKYTVQIQKTSCHV